MRIDGLEDGGSPDRVNFSFGMKVNLGNYQSADFHLSLSSDVKGEESVKDALKRCEKFVEAESERKLAELGKITIADK